MAAADMQSVLQLAKVHHDAGRLPQAEQLYRQILAQQPGQPHALHMLGVLAGQCGRHDQAVELIGRSLAADPTSAEANFNFGVALAAQGMHDRAAAGPTKPVYVRADGRATYAVVAQVMASLSQSGFTSFEGSGEVAGNFTASQADALAAAMTSPT